jgi:hypothetical protein
MAERTIGKNIHGQPIFYGTASDLAAKTAIIDALAEYRLPDGSRYQSNGAGGWTQTHAAGGAALVNLRDSSGTEITSFGNAGAPGTLVATEISNPLSGTRTTLYFTGATSFFASFYEYTATATAKELRMVFNAIDDADADVKAVTPGQRDILKIGTIANGLLAEFNKTFSNDNKCVRADIYSDAAAEAGTTKAYAGGVSP